jgi:serine/threonine-protein kinase
MSTFEERLSESLSHAYTIESELGGGGMSRVFVATDKSLGRKIVIKFLSPELTAGVNRDRFRREIQVAAQLQHPHIVTLLAAGEDGEIVYYTMPFIEGESLKTAIEKNGPMSVRDVVRVLYDVVDALAYAHARGVVHRDIKPANILRSGNHSLVTDFGVAKALNAAMPSTAMTSTGMAIGTPAYMAPEQLAGDPAADHRIDIYAVGLLAYELLTGQSPFAALSPQAVMAALLTVDPKPVDQIRKDVPRRLSLIIMQCLQKDPANRPPTAEGLLNALDTIATASGEIRTREHKVPLPPVVKKKTPTMKSGSVSIPGIPVPAPTFDEEEEEAAPSSGRNKLLIGGLVVLLLAAGGFVLSQKMGGKNQTVATAQAPVPGSSADSAAKVAGAAAATPTVTAPVAPPVITKIDSMAIAAAVAKRIAQAQAEAAKKPGTATINADSLRRVAQQQATDSVNAVKAAAAAAAAPVPAPVAPAAPRGTPPFSVGTHRLAIVEPVENKDQPSINSFSAALSAAIRSQMDKDAPFALVDQSESRSAVAASSSRDEAVRTLRPDVLISQTYTGTGDTVKVTVTVRDMKGTSTYGTRMINSRVMPAYPQYFVNTIAAAVVKQLEELQKAPSIFGR